MLCDSTYALPRKGKFLETGSRLEVISRQGVEELVFNGDSFIWEDGKFWRWMGGWLPNSVNVFKATELDA